MPELPEVEVVRRGLERHVVGASVRAVEVLHERPVRREAGGPSAFAEKMTGRTVRAARRRGKYFWLALDEGDALLGHLGMSGQMLVQPSGAPDERHLRVRFVLDDGNELRFVDQRMFGGLSFAPGGAELPAEIAHIGRDQLDEQFDLEDVARRMRGRSVSSSRAWLRSMKVTPTSLEPAFTGMRYSVGRSAAAPRPRPRPPPPGLPPTGINCMRSPSMVISI